MKIKIFILIILLVLTKYSFGQKYILENEQLIYSFKTLNNKTMTLCKDNKNKYIVYRFGNTKKIEFEYPNKKDSTSWTKFRYTYAFRGGGIANEGIDLNYVEFTENNFKYVIYDTYFANGEKYNIGIKVIDLKTNKIINIKGIKKSQKGNIVDFRFNGLLKEGDELYD